MRKIFAIALGMVMLLSITSIFVVGDTEPNDSFAEADYTYDGDIISGTLNEFTDEYDYYRMWLTADNTVSITMSSYADDFDMELYDSDMDFSIDESTDWDSNELIIYTVSTSGYYYLEVYAVSGSGSYTLYINVESAASDDGNDDFWEADYTYDGDTIYGLLDQSSDYADYYRLWVSEDETITVTMTGTGDDFDIFLYDYMENNVDYSDNSGTSTEEIIYKVLSSGNYYIEVVASSGDGDYTLNVDAAYDLSATGSGPAADVPDWNVGQEWAFGNVVDIEKVLNPYIEDTLTQLDAFGFETVFDINGGAGLLFGIEVTDDSTMVNGEECYDTTVNAAVAIDFDMEASVDGATSLFGPRIIAEGEGTASGEGEIVVAGNVYFTKDKLAIAKIDLKISAEIVAEAYMDATVTVDGDTEFIEFDAEFSAEDVEVNLKMNFDPPIDLFDFPIMEGDVWYVPHTGTDTWGSVTASGVVRMDVSGNGPDGAVINEREVEYLNDLNDGNFESYIDGGPGRYGGGTLFECTDLTGDVYTIEYYNDNSMDIFGTRQDTGIMNTLSTIQDSTAGVQFDASSGFVTGITVNGDTITDTATMDEVEDFTADPQGEVDEVIDGGSGAFGILLIIIIVVVVAVVMMVVIMNKKKSKQPPQHHQPQPYGGQQSHQPYDGHQQPPPPPQHTPEQYPPQENHQQPPPPPPQY